MPPTTPSSAPIGALELRGIGVGDPNKALLEAVEFRLHPGELCALIGPSGAGKSTLMKVILGIRTPDRGTVSLAGQPVQSVGPLGYVPQDDALHTGLSPRTALRFAAALRLPNLGKSAREAKVEEVIRRVELAERADLRISRLSGGQRKRVSLAMELLSAPPLLLLDEPTSGLDPGLEAKMMDLFREVAATGPPILVSTHSLSSLERCHLVLVMAQGRILFLGPPSEVFDWFEAKVPESLFPNIARHAPLVWARKWSTSPAATRALQRPPAAPPPEPAFSQEQPLYGGKPNSNEPPPIRQSPAPTEPHKLRPLPSNLPVKPQAPARQSPAEQLAALKAQRERGGS